MNPRKLTATRQLTLIELIVSMGIFAMLGTALMLVLRGGLATWNTGEARRESSQVAQTIFGMLREDFQSVTIYRRRLGKSGPVETKLLGDYDVEKGDYLGKKYATYRQRIFLTRSLKAESENAVTGIAGTALNATGRVDFHNDSKEALNQNLRATSGLMEVAYLRGGLNSDTLYRAARSPIGGQFTLFNWDRLPTARLDPQRDGVYNQVKPLLEKIKTVRGVYRSGTTIFIFHDGTNTNSGIQQLALESPEVKAFAKALEEQDLSLEARELNPNIPIETVLQDLRCRTWAQPVANNVLFFGVEYWHEHTGSWQSNKKIYKGKDDLGPLDYWDSTRGILNDPSNKDAFKLFKAANSVNNAKDDVLPRKVRITLVIREHANAGTETELLADISDSDDTLSIKAPGRAPRAPGYVRIGQEWIKYDDVSGTSLTVTQDGRGARSTTASDHPAGSEVIFGRVFQTVITIPTYVENWED